MSNSGLDPSKKIVLKGQFVSLEPLCLEHAPLLWEAMKDDVDQIFRWMPYAMKASEDAAKMVQAALQEHAEGRSVPFATVALGTGKVVGSTRFLNIDAANRRVEIGSTWIAPAWQRTAINTEAKHLMLRHAFESWGCLRVEFKTDALNEKSRNAILRLGAKQEGIFRKHMVTASGRIRASVYFSIVDAEWPAIKTRLEEMLAKSSHSKSLAFNT